MKIAIIGWGSLIWDPKNLKTISDDWYEDGPMLPVEFARISNDGRLTLVIIPRCEKQRTLWTVSALTAIEEARENLRLREGRTKSQHIHSRIRGGAAKPDSIPREVLAEIDGWLEEHLDIDAVVWTGLPSNWEEKRGCSWSPIEAKAYLNSLVGDVYKKAEEYIDKAPSQIRTEFRKRLR